MLSLMADTDDEGGTPAQTGSLTHAGVAAFHKEKGGLEIRKKAAWDAIAKFKSGFPLADLDETRLFITPYMDDPRNIHALFAKWSDGEDAVEKGVEFTLPAHRMDPTGAPIYVQGTFDQIRMVNGVPRVYDLKTGKKTGWEMIHDYAVQLAAYTYGARQVFPDAEPGYIIRNYGYRVRGANLPAPDGIFWSMPFKWNAIDILLDKVRLEVALIRIGEINFNPGPHCTYCEFEGLTGCLPRFEVMCSDSERVELEIISE